MTDDATHAAVERIRGRFDDGWGQWIDCEEGWWPILVRLDADFAAIDPGFRLHQVKQKWGGLRWYYEPSVGLPQATCDLLEARLREAEAEAAATCELCGQPGRLARRHSLYASVQTLCDAHRLERGEQSGVPWLWAEDWTADTILRLRDEWEAGQ